MRVAVAAASLLGAVLVAGRAWAGEPEWPAAPYDYVVVDQDLRTVLEQFGINTGLRVVLSDAVQGRVRGRLPPAPPRRFLDHLTEMFGLDWYYDGAVIAISAKSEAQSAMIKLKKGGFQEFRRAFATAGFSDRRYQLQPGPEGDSVIASGPPRYLAVVKQLAANLSPPQESTQVTIIRGSTATHVEFP